MRMMIQAILSLAILFPLSAYTQDKHDDFWLTLSGTSYHFKNQSKYNDKNLGLGFEKELNKKWSFALGYYDNSWEIQSNYIGFNYMPFTIWKLKVGAFLGEVSGYDDEDHKKYIPAAIPMIMYERDNWGVNAAIVPPLNERITGMIGLQLKIKF